MKGEYTKTMFKNEILLFMRVNGYEAANIAKFTSKMYFLHQADLDLALREKMLDIMTMEDGPEFEMTENEFNEFLDKI